MTEKREDEEFIKRIRNLLRAIDGEIEENSTSEDECNSYVKDLESIKEDLSDEDKDWIENYSEIDEVSGSLFSDVTKKDMKNKLIEVKSQASKIFRRLGGDLDEPTKNLRENTSAPVIQVFQNQSQNQYQSQEQSQNIQIEELKKELEEELGKRNPNPNKVSRTLKEIIEVAKNSASGIITGIILKVLGI